ncbi:MAG: tetratricopeptide repeat protein [Chitinivibrionales bacterium]|nr:tetratricopeptide repeat protein [Chitinivibrionales bacterium]MBD3395706.1 tetratricopeptide repeat protein [Chitinivibrionales bacterium]
MERHRRLPEPAQAGGIETVSIRGRIRFLLFAAAALLSSCAAMRAGRGTNQASAPPGADSAAVQEETMQPGPDSAAVGEAAQDSSTKTKTLSSASELMLKACQNYIEVNPESPKVPEVLALKGSVFYNNGFYGKSREVYRRIIEEHEKSPYRLEAIRMVAQSHYQEKNFDEAQEWYRRMQDAASTGADKEEARAAIAQSIFKMGESYELSQRYEDAAAQYERVALEFPEAAIADIALLNAGLAYEKIAEWSRAILIYQRLGKKYKESKLIPKSMFRTAKCYEKLREWENAAKTYLVLVKDYPTSDLTEAALYNAGFSFENANKLIEAAATFEKLAYSFPKSADAADVLFRAGELYGRLKDWPNVTRVNTEFSRRYGGDIDRVVQAQCMVGVALYMQNKQDDAVRQLAKAVDTYRQLERPSDVNRFYAAKAQFTIGEIYHDQQNDIALTLPRRTYQRQLRDKSRLLDDAVDAYSKAVRFEISEWTTRSIYQAGQAYEDFAVGVFKQQRPAGLGIEQQLALELGIANAVEEYFVDRALAYHEQNVKLGIKEKLEDKYVVLSREKLTYLPYTAGRNFLALVDIAKGVASQEHLEGFALIAQKLQMLQKIAPFQERAIALFRKTLDLGTMYHERNEFYGKASGLVTKTSFTVGETYASVAQIAREAPIPGDFDKYEKFVYKKKLLDQIQAYEDNALKSYLTTTKIAEAYEIDDDFVKKTRDNLSRLLFIRGRCYDLLGISAYADPPYPDGIAEAEKREYLARFQEIALRFQEQAFDIYRVILEYADQGYATGEYVHHAYVRMYQNYPEEFGRKQEKITDRSISSGPEWKCLADSQPGWHGLDFADAAWHKVRKSALPDTVDVSGFPAKIPTPMWLYRGDSETSAATAFPSLLYFRRVFYVTEPPHEAKLFLASDGEFSLFLNGDSLASAHDSAGVRAAARQWDLAGKLRQGKNVLAARVAHHRPGRPIGIMPYLSLTVTVYEYLPVFPGTDIPMERKLVSEGSWVFPYIKNYSPGSRVPSANN